MPPSSPQALQPVSDMSGSDADDSSSELASEESSDGSLPEEDVSSCEDDDLLDHLDEPATSNPDGMSVGAVLLTVFQWMAKHKATDSSTIDLWSMLRLLLPAVSDVGTFQKLKRLLSKHMLDTVEEIHLCVNSCIGFFNCESELLRAYRHAHRKYCVICGEKRYLPGGSLPRKVAYYFPLRPWFKDMFR